MMILKWKLILMEIKMFLYLKIVKKYQISKKKNSNDEYLFFIPKNNDNNFENIITFYQNGTQLEIRRQ